ncbi:hypothetical protein ABWR64_09055, partial [Enterococcus faecium]
MNALQFHRKELLFINHLKKTVTRPYFYILSGNKLKKLYLTISKISFVIIICQIKRDKTFHLRNSK